MLSFTVIIPAYNSSKTIELAINSTINQSLPPKEVIVVDDCSTDDTVLKVKKIQFENKKNIIIKLLSTCSNSGPATARNLGWNNASGCYVAFLDSDDQWHSLKLARINQVLLKNLQIEVLGHCNTSLNESMHLTKISKLSILAKNFSITPNLIIKKIVKERFDEKMRYTEDHDLLLRISGNNILYYLSGAGIPTILGRSPLTAGGLSGNRFGMRLGELYMYKKFMCRDLLSFSKIPLILIIVILKLIMEFWRVTKSKL
jgi:teichuronic acid biosynthesis glycosyltransferase TuaG